MKKYPRFTCFSEYNRLIKEYHEYRQNLPKEKLVAYVTSGAPIEILEALDIVTVYPENYGATCGVMKVSTRLCGEAEKAGYQQDLCSYAKGHIASSLNLDSAEPVGRLPAPDMLLCCTNICGTVLPWYQRLAEIYDCPLFVLDIPFQFSGDEEPHAVAYVKNQMKELGAWAEKLAEAKTGTSLDEGRLEEVMTLSKDTIDLWSEIRSLGVHTPSPISISDLFISMAPVVVMRGKQEALDFYTMMKREIEERISSSIAAVPGEKYRLLWDNIAIWADLFRFYRFFAEADACFVADTYTGAWSIPLSLDDPIEGLSRAYTAPFINLNISKRLQVMESMAADFQAHGMVMHSNRSCKPFSFTQGFLRKRFTEITGRPVLSLEADMCDTRSYNPGVLRERITAFLEMLSG